MARKIKQLQPPTGLGRLLFRFPIWIYRLRLGWLFGNRLLLLNHIGRKSGLRREAVLEAVRYDRETDTYVVAAAFGEKTHWYQNILKRPEVSIQVGRQKVDMVAEQLSPAEGGDVMVDFCKRHPVEARLVNWIGYEVDGSEEDYRAVGEMITFVAFHPR